jgi:hypothetical protein
MKCNRKVRKGSMTYGRPASAVKQQVTQHRIAENHLLQSARYMGPTLNNVKIVLELQGCFALAMLSFSLKFHGVVNPEAWWEVAQFILNLQVHIYHHCKAHNSMQRGQMPSEEL